MEAKSFTKISCFTLRIIAFVSMIFDHLGVILTEFYKYDCPEFITACRYLGRFALPIFCLLLVEGVLLTRSLKKYGLRLGIYALIMMAFMILTYYVKALRLQSLAEQGNIFIDLFLGFLMLACIKQKNNYLKILAILPISIAILSFFAKTQQSLSWYPVWLYMQYDILSIATILGFYLAYILTDAYYEYRSTYSGISLDMIKETPTYRLSVNLFSILTLVVVNVLFYFIKYAGSQYLYWNPNIQIFAVVAGIFILFYNGKRGYDKKWFRIFSYSFYPVHILIIYAIVYVIYICTH